MSPRWIIVAQSRRPRATMIPRGDIPLSCTLNQSPFVLLYIWFGRDGRIHGHKPLLLLYIWFGIEATMIPRGDIPLSCTLNQSPFVLLYIWFGRDGRIHGHKPLLLLYIWFGIDERIHGDKILSFSSCHDADCDIWLLSMRETLLPCYDDLAVRNRS